MKRVSFKDDLTSVGEFQPSILESEYSSIWYSGQQLRNFRADAKAIRRDPKAFDPRTDCFRGLEPYVSRRHDVRTFRKEHVRNMLALQGQNCFQKFVEPTALRQLAAQQSRDSAERALTVATRDYVEALKTYRETPDLKPIKEEFLGRYHNHYHVGLIARPITHGSAAALSA